MVALVGLIAIAIAGVGPVPPLSSFEPQPTANAIELAMMRGVTARLTCVAYFIGLTALSKETECRLNCNAQSFASRPHSG